MVVKRVVKRHWLRDGLEGLFLCGIIVAVLLFLNDAGVISLTNFSSAPSIVALSVGWPFIMGAVMAGLSAMDSGGNAYVILAYSLGGLVLNVLYAFGLGVLVGWAVRKMRG